MKIHGIRWTLEGLLAVFLLATPVPLLQAVPRAYVDSVRAALEQRKMPEEILFLPAALSELTFADVRVGIWSIPVLDLLRAGCLPEEADSDRSLAMTVALNRLEELHREYGDWKRVYVAYAESPTSARAMEDSALGSSAIILALKQKSECYATNPPEAFAGLAQIAAGREERRLILLQEEAARMQSRVDSLKKTGVPQQADRIVYTVRRGDTLSGIAARYRVRVPDLKKWNNLHGDMIRDGRKLTIYRRQR